MSVWLGGFFNPQSLLTAIMQSTARRYELPLDKMCLQCDVTKKMKEDFTYIYTLKFNFLIRSDKESNIIKDQWYLTSKTEFCSIADTRCAPRDGAYVHGLLMEGARWDVHAGIIMDSRLKDLFPPMPVINVRVANLFK